jgi:serine/threonine-protein kinase HipA
MFSLLAASGLDVIGDVSAALEPVLEEHQPLEPSELEKTSFVDLFQKSISSTDYAERNTDFSIPGVQPKLSAELVSFPLALKNRKKGYILKFAPKKFPNIVENEHFFMRLAADCGIQTAKTQLVYDRDGVSGLLVERFDRIWDKELKALTRIHQEDSCQFLSRYPQDKYRLSMRQITEGLYQHASSPIIEAARLVELTAFSYLTANGDQHAKNVSLHVEPGSLRIVLTPAYDLVSTLPYGDQTLALTIEGKNSKLRPKDFFTWGGRAGVREPAIRSTLARLAEGIRPATDRLEEIGLEQKRTDFLRKTMLERLEALCDI